MRGLSLRRPSPALVVAVLALFVALDGPATAARMINGKNIRTGTVSSKQIRDKGIAARDLSANALRSARYTPRNGITSSKLRRNAVTGRAIAAGAVTSLQVADNSLVAQDLATGSVTSDEIADGNVRNADLANSAVTKGKLAGNSVGASEVVNGSLTAGSIGSFTGAVALTFGTLQAGQCQAVSTGAQTPLAGAQDLRDDIIVLGRPSDMPATLVVSAQPDPNSATAFNVIGCNVAEPPATNPTPPATDPSVFGGGTYTLRFVTINP